ncbi:MAG: hypothetical protein ACOZAO_02360 [Patescibacteria group bacterium]
MPKKIKLPLVIAITILLVCALIYALALIAFNGGIKGAIQNLKPPINPYGKQAITQRATARQNIYKTFAEINDLKLFTEYATSSHDRCHKGKSSWKRTDAYSNTCVYKITKFYGFNEDFKETMFSFEDGLVNLGWKYLPHTDKYPMESLMEYYDKNHGAKLINSEGTYYVSNLPSSIATYLKVGQTLEINLAEKATHDLKSFEYTQKETSGTAGVEVTYEEKDLKDVYEVFEGITKQNQFVIAISIQTTYIKE